jgi:SAM-dependent methyltransferase
MDVSKLKPGDDHYMAYVGPPTQYDFMGATQFRLLCSLGLRSSHHVLDVGCGSLRAGRLLIVYLDVGRYFGIEPNEWLIRDAIENQLGKDLIYIKKPQFDYNSDFAADVFSQQFDFIVAQSVFSHTGSDLVNRALGNFGESLKANGLIVATFIEGARDFDGSGWVYPGCVSYRRSTIRRFAEEAGLFLARIPWYHPRQTWYLLSRNRSRLPNSAMLGYLSGVVLFDPEFAESWKSSQRIFSLARKHARRILPQTMRGKLKRILANRETDLP